MNARLSLLALVILVALGFGLLYAPHGRPPESTPASPVTPQVASAVPSAQAQPSLSTPVMAPTDLEGLWTLYDDVDKTVWVCKLRMTAANGGYTATTVEVSEDADQAEVVTSDHRYDGQNWTFKSSLHEGLLAVFDLHRTGPDEFQGYATVDGDQEDLLFTFKREAK